MVFSKKCNEVPACGNVDISLDGVGNGVYCVKIQAGKSVITGYLHLL
jgi:hypothetical protein